MGNWLWVLTQSLTAFAVASDGALLLSGTFEGKVDLGSGVQVSAGDDDVFVGRVAPGAPISSGAPAGGPPLPAGYSVPPPPRIACGATAACDVAPSACADAAPDCRSGACDRIWFVYYENPRCVDGWCAWDEAYFRCTDAFHYCVKDGACIYQSPTN